MWYLCWVQHNGIIPLAMNVDNTKLLEALKKGQAASEVSKENPPRK